MKYKYSTKKANSLIDLLKSGCTITQSCAGTNISRLTYYDWLKNEPEFVELISKAKDEIDNEAKQNAINAIKSNFTKNWTSAAWFLERSYPDEYGRKDQVKSNVTIDTVKIRYIVPDQPVIEDKPTYNITINSEQNNLEDE